MDSNIARELNKDGGRKRFKFQSFRKRIESVDIKVTRRVIKHLDEPDVQGSYFQESLEAWRELNCTTHFTKFSREIQPYSNNLPQLLFHKHEVVNILKRYIRTADGLSIRPLLDLTSVLSRDLIDEFLPFYEPIMKTLVPLAYREDFETVESCFNTMAYLFKYLLKLIITDLRPTFRIIMCLLGKEYEKPHIRRFAAESFAFLLRKCNPQQMSTILTYMLQCYSESSTVTFQQGLLLLFTEAVKSVSGRLHSKTGRLFTVLLDNLHQEEVTAEEPESGCVYQLTVAFIKIVWQNFQKEDLVVLWTVLHRDLQRIAQLLREQEGAPEERTLQDLLQTTGLWLVAVTVNKGSRVLDFKPWMSELNALEDLVSVVDAHDSDTGKAVSQLALQVQHNLAHVGLSMLLFAPLEVSMSSGKVFLDRLFTQRSPAVVLPFALSLAKLGWVHFNSILLPYLIRYTQRHWRTHFDEVVLFWNRVFALNILTLKPDQVSRYLNTHGQVCFPLSTEKSNDEPQTEGMTLQAQGFVEALLAYLQLPFDWQLTGEQLVHQRYYDKAQSNSRHATAEETDPDAMLAEYSSEDGDDDESDGSLSSNDSNVTSLTNALPLSTVLNLLSFVEVPVVPALEALSELTQSLSEALVAYGDAGDTDLEAPGSEFALQCLMGQLVQTQMKLLEIQGDIEPDRLESYWVPYMDKNFKYCRRCPVYLRAIVSYLQLVQKVPTLADTHLDSEGLQHFYPILIENVSSFYHELRSPTLAILAFFQPLPLNTPEEKLQLGQRVVPGKESKTCPIVSLALEVEDTPATLDQYRDKLNPLRRMLTLYLAHRVPDLYLDLLPRLCLSMLSVNFKLVWQEAIDGFQQLARVYPTVAWQLLFQEIERFEYQRRLFEFRFPMSIEKSYVTQRDTTSGPRRLPRAALFLSGVRSQCTYWLRYRFFVGQHQALFKSSRVTQGLWYQFIKNCEIETTRMDYWNYFQQIMQTLLSVNHLAEQHYKPLMTIFLRFVYQHYPYLPNDLVFHHLPDGTPLATLVARIFEQNGPLGTDEVGGTVTMPTVQNQPGLAVKNNPKVVLYKLTQYLILLSRFRNPLTIQKTAYLQPIFLNLLTKGDHSLQSLALECLVSWRASSSLSPYKGRLRRLLLDRKCRDELTKFDLSPAATKRNIKPMDRPEVIMALVRLLAGRLMDQKGRRAHSAGITARRTAILNALTLLPPEELQPFFDILVEPFRVAWAKMTQTDRASRLPHEWLADFGEFRVQYDSQGVFQMNLDQNFVRWVDSNVQLGFVNMLYHLIKQMKTRVIPFIPLMLSILLHMVAEVEQQLTNLSGADGFEVAADTDEMMESDVMDEDLMDEEEESASELGSQGSSDEEEVVNGEESEDEVDEAVDSGIEVASDDNQSDDEIEPDDESFITQDLSANHSRRSRGGHSRSKVKALRQLRQFITHRIRQLFELTSGYDFVPFLPAIFTHVINPRLSSLTDENIQSPSALLKLVESWSLQPQYLDYLSAYNADLLPRLLDLLSKSKVRSTVVYLVLDMVQNILEMAQFRQETPSNQNELPSLTTGTLNPSQAMLLDDIPRYQAVAETLLRSYMEPLLAHFSTLLHRQNFTGKSVSNIGGVPRRLISLLAQLGEFVDHPEYARQLLQDLLPLVRKTSRTISEELRHNVLDIFSAFLPLLTDQLQGGFSQSPLYCEYYDFVSRMFATLKAPDSRTRLVGLFQQLATIDNGQQLPHVVDLVADMNRYVMGGEPDYNCRLSAYARLNETLYQQLTVREWLPVLCNLTFYINDVEELAFRNHSSFGIIRFTECVAQQHSKCSDVSSHDDPERLAYTEMVRMLGNVVYNTLQRQLSAPDETIRLEWLRVLAKLVEICPFFGNLGHLQVLFMKDQEEEERNFFENIYHVQTYRRVRALQDLTVICEDSQSPITPKLLYSVIIPIISHFIAPAQGKQEVQLAEETIQALAVIARHLPWDQYRHLVSSFLRRATASKIPPSEQVEAAVAILNVFHFDVTLWQEYSELNDSLVEVPDTEDKSSESGDISPTDAEDAVEDEDVGSEGEDETLSDQEGEGMVEESQSSAYAQALQSKRIHDTILLDFLPRFKKFLGSGAHSSPKIRVRIALPATVLLRRLPPQSYKNHLPGLITTVCNLLRSKAQNTRTVTRETLVTMVRILKAEFLSFVLKELKSSLRRGFQRHVLGFTAHAILEAVIQQGVQPGELDDCVEPALDILVDDIFGDLAQEKRVTGITNTTEEAKACMSLHSFELLAQSVSFSRVGELLVPLKGLLSETENKTTMEKVDEVLQGISQGLYRNPGVELRDLLVFCHGLITRNLALTVNKEKEHALKWNQNREDPLYTVYTSVAQFRGTKDYFSVNVHRFTNFGLGLLLRVVKDSHRLQTVEVDKVNLLDPFVDIVGNCLYSTHTSVTMQALSIMAHLHTMPLPTMQATMELLVERIFQLLRTAGNTQSTLVQTCFALLASLIHEHRQTVKVKPSQVAFLLSLIQPDLDEFENHGTNFKLLRSIIERKVHAPEIFDVLDRISEKMVIHPTAHVRDKCRRIYFQFLVHYPLTQKRLAQNMNFLVKNLSFNFESGRESVLEMMNTIVNKFSDELLANFVELFFVGLASLLVNDESKQCREMAATLMQRLFSRMNNDHLTNVTVLLDTWFTDGLDVVCRVAYDHHLDNRLSELVNFEVPERGQLQPTGELVEDVFEAIGGQVHRRVPLYRTEIPKLRLQRTSMQIYGLLVEALGSECRPHSSNLSGQVINALIASEILWRATEQLFKESVASLSSSFTDQEVSKPQALEWELSYLSLVTLTKYGKQFSGVMFGEGDQTTFWPLVINHMTYPHSWTRLAASRLVGLCLANCQSSEVNKGRCWLLDTPHIFTLTRQSFQQLFSLQLRDDLGTQLTKNLFFLGKCFYIKRMACPVVDDGDQAEPISIEGQTLPSDDEEDESQISSIKSHSYYRLLPLFSATADSESDPFADTPVASPALEWLFSRMAFLAKKATRSPIETSCCQQRAVFRWFAAMLTCVDSEDLAHYLKYIITPLHHVLNTWTVKDPAANSLKQLAQEVWEFALKQAGTTNFHVALSYVQESLDYSRGKNREMRQARKAQRKRPGDDDDEPTQVTNVDIVHSLKKRRGNNVVKSKRRLHNTR